VLAVESRFQERPSPGYALVVRIPDTIVELFCLAALAVFILGFRPHWLFQVIVLVGLLIFARGCYRCWQRRNLPAA
jgi:hypothetical protein